MVVVRSWQSLFVILGCLCILGCNAPREAESHWIRGAVTDALSGAPIENVRVILEGSETTVFTDHDGSFAIPAITTGRHALHFSHAGHLAARRLQVVAGAGEPMVLWPEDPSEEAVIAHLQDLERARHNRDDPHDPALRPEARAYLLGETLRPTEHADGVGRTTAALEPPPETIRVWRRSIDGASSSCEGRIDEIPLEDYVGGVLPHEWIPSWDIESMRAGSIAIRTYAAGWVLRGGKYDCADLDDTTRSQVYRDERNDRATGAIADTEGGVIATSEGLVSGEYSAENGDPTAYGVDDPVCSGRELFGHGRGMCQWGSQRWALEGRDHAWIANHYYPGATVEYPDSSLPDYDASLRSINAPTQLNSGERARIQIDFRNEGRRTWDLSGTRLALTAPTPSRFFDDENWFAVDAPTPPDRGDFASGDDGTFTFWITAPEVSATERVNETFQLRHGSTLFGPEITLSIEVLPGTPSVSTTVPIADAGSAASPGRSRLSAGCGVRPPSEPTAWFWSVLVGLLVLRARRRNGT